MSEQGRDERQPHKALRVSYELMPDELHAKLYPLLQQDHLGLDAIVPTRYISLVTGWVWYPIGFDGDERFVGMVQGWAEEVGLFTFEEMLVYGGGFVLRDLDFTPQTLRVLRSANYTYNSDRYAMIPLIVSEEQ